MNQVMQIDADRQEAIKSPGTVPSITCPPVKRLPKVGEQVAIRHQVKRKPDGEVIGMQRNDRPEVVDIAEVYMDGTVRTGLSDVWEVTLNAGFRGDRGAQWMTVNPAHTETK